MATVVRIGVSSQNGYLSGSSNLLVSASNTVYPIVPNSMSAVHDLRISVISRSSYFQFISPSIGMSSVRPISVAACSGSGLEVFSTQDTACPSSPGPSGRLFYCNFPAPSHPHHSLESATIVRFAKVGSSMRISVNRRPTATSTVS